MDLFCEHTGADSHSYSNRYWSHSYSHGYGDGNANDNDPNRNCDFNTRRRRRPGATPTATPGATLTAQVASTPALTSVNRIGVNLSGNDSGSASDYMQNMFDNPGFEPITDAHLIVIGSGASSNSFTDSADPGTKSSGYWVGATASVRTGAAAGDQFTITSYTAGGAYTYGSCENSTGGSISCPTLASGVAVMAVVSGTDLYGGIGGGNAIGGWSAGDTQSELSTAAAYDGQGSLAINVADGSSHSVHFSWDQYVVNGGGVCSNDDVTPCTLANENTDCGGSNTCLFAPYSGPWHPVVGPFEVAFYALASSTSTGAPQVSFTLSRSGGVNASHTWTLTNDGNWHQYIYNFTGNDTSAGTQNPMTFTLTGTNGGAESGATIYVDDAYLGKAAASTTGFRNEMITTLSTMKVGSLRIMDGGTIDANDAQLEGLSGCTWGGGGSVDQTGTCDFQHGPAFADGVGTGQWTYSSTDLYPLSSQLGAVPWITISNGFSDADLKTFVDNACTAFSTYNFPSIWIEQSNENWNGGGTNLIIRRRELWSFRLWRQRGPQLQRDGCRGDGALSDLRQAACTTSSTTRNVIPAWWPRHTRVRRALAIRFRIPISTEPAVHPTIPLPVKTSRPRAAVWLRRRQLMRLRFSTT